MAIIWTGEREHAGRLNLLQLLQRAEISKTKILLTLDGDVLVKLPSIDRTKINKNVLTFSAPLSMRRRGVEAKMVSGNGIARVDNTLQSALVKASSWIEKIKSGQSLSQISRTEGICNRYIRKCLPLATLAPVIQKAIMEGTQPVDLTLETIVSKKLPLCWSEQQKLLGFS